MKATDKIDAARVDLLLGELRLPGIKLIWAALAATADKEGWPAAPIPGGPDQLDAGQSQLAEQQVDASGVDLVGRLHAASPTLVAI